MAVLPTLSVSGTPYGIGFEIGKAFAPMIGARLAEDENLRTRMIPFSNSKEGEELVEALIATNQKRYPNYWEELRGLADGSSVPFSELMLLNLRKEILPFIVEKDAAVVAAEPEPDQCSDVLLCSKDAALVGHNEDADVYVKNRAYLVHVTTQDGCSWTAYTYAGELPSCAFGFNSNGIAFSLNAVAPKSVVRGGVARNFVSRDLLEATSLDDALQRVQVPTLAAGHNYNIMDVNNRRIVNVETASCSQFAVKEIGDEAYFHANMYLNLKIPQKTTPSTLHRQERAAKFPLAKCARDILEILGDTEDESFPIFMHGTHVMETGGGLYWTLSTALFDLDRREVLIYLDNPKSTDPALRLPLPTNNPTSGQLLEGMKRELVTHLKAQRFPEALTATHAILTQDPSNALAAQFKPVLEEKLSLDAMREEGSEGEGGVGGQDEDVAADEELESEESEEEDSTESDNSSEAEDGGGSCSK